MVAMNSSIMDVDGNRTSFKDLYGNDEKKCLEVINEIKSMLIGSNKQKKVVIEQGALPRLVTILTEHNFSPDLKVNVAYTLGSIAKGQDFHLKALIDCGIVPILLHSISLNNDPKLIEACLSVLRTVFQHPDAPVEMIYAHPNTVPQLIRLMVQSPSNQISVSVILTNACKTKEHRSILAMHGLVTALNILLCSPHPDVQLPALQCLAYLVCGHDEVAQLVVSSTYNDKSLLSQIVLLMDRNRKIEMQLAAARCVSYLCRCGVVPEDSRTITYKALPCLVRMTKQEETVENRILAADTLAFLIEGSADLQRIAAISNHLIPSLSLFLKWTPAAGEEKIMNPDVNANNTITATPPLRRQEAESNCLTREMKRVAFRVFGALSANDEDIRKRIIETDNLMTCLVQALEEENCCKLQMAAIGCLHTLSRSVQLLRTTFQDHPVWKPLFNMMKSSPNLEQLDMASSILCNLMLEFSPSKEPLLEEGAIDVMCHLTQKYESSLRMNGAWGLMNMAFQSDQRVKIQIIKALGSDQIFRLLSDQEMKVVMKTLGLVRNLLSPKHHTDQIMSSHGTQIMQAVVLILESDNIPEVKEQALCILANIADGDSAKQFIMSNEDVLKKVTSYMMHGNSKLQIAAVVCVLNLTLAKDEGAIERQAKLRDFGVHRILQGLLSTTDSALFEKVKEALQQFP